MPIAPANRARFHALLACAGTCFIYWRFPGLFTLSLVGVAAILALLAFLLPKAYTPVQRAFDRLTHALLVTVSWTTLGVIFFGLLTPLRLWRALTRQDPLRLRQGATPASYLQPLARTAPRFDRQF